MLQINWHRKSHTNARLPFCMLLACLYAFPVWAAPQPAHIDWLLEDADEEEFVPLHDAALATPPEVKAALESYHAGDYRRTVEILEKVRKLELPDGRHDFITFVLAESYRQMSVKDKARGYYRAIIRNFPKSDKVAPGLFRIFEFAAHDANIALVDSIYTVFQTNYRKHPLFNSVAFGAGRLYYREGRYGEAIQLLDQVAKNSTRHVQAQFVASLCNIKNKEFKKALLQLDFVRRTSQDPLLTAEANIVIGDIYYNENSVPVALQYYQNVPKGAKRHSYALVKMARALLDLGKSSASRDMARTFLRKNRNSELFFEMASVLEQAYQKLGDERQAAQVGNMIHRQIIDARLAFEVYEEIDRLTDLLKSWELIEFDAIRSGSSANLQHARENMNRIRELEIKCRTLMHGIETSMGGVDQESIPHLAERRYLALLKKQILVFDDSLLDIGNSLNMKATLAKGLPDDSVLAVQVDSISATLDSVKAAHARTQHEYDLVVRDCLGSDYEGRQTQEDMQAKFVDWAFIKYQSKKEELKKANIELSGRKKAKATPDSVVSVNQDVLKLFSTIDKDKLEKTIVTDRERLVRHIKTMMDVYPKNRYNSQILFRLSELYYDDATDDFQVRLRAYEQKMAEGDTAGVDFPDYDLTEVINIYDRINELYPRDDLADDALFYKSLALQKLGTNEEANNVLLDLVERFPESEFYVEANMNIGRYYFEHPKEQNNQGYKLAEEAYRKVLFYRDHPQFVQALYHLGWCYYMQDQFEEAIAVFKYLVEEVELDFDPNKMEEQQVVNPLLRGEAIDYIAISFDQEGRTDDAIKFLELIGNADYSAMVLKRIGELREEDLEFAAAEGIYRRLLKEYPKSSIAPDASVSLIKLFENREKLDSAMIERESFFRLYCPGSEWQQYMTKRDTTLLGRVDSMAISIGLYVADASYRKAEASIRGEYEHAAQAYRAVVSKYPKHPRAVEARWNLAVILDAKIGEKAQAYDEYISFSKIPEMDPARREQSALNAISIAQSLLPADSLIEKGTVDFAASKVVDAVDNYAALFSAGKSTRAVLLNKAAVYFNRHMFKRAAEVYEKIISSGGESKEYFEALSYLGQCYFGEENWPAASKAFERVWRESKDPVTRASAYKLLLQADFLNAKKIMALGEYENAALAFRSIEEKYPGSEYGDIVLFNAAEAYEKKEMWTKSGECYLDIIKKYPGSKLAPDALFNAAGNYEKTDKFAKAAEAYEIIVSQYSESEKAKDALFNLGFCYEKLNKLEKMAEVNERYSLIYPGEKDVEAMLLRSAAFYARAGMHDRAISVFRNFVRRFPKSPKTIEAMFMIAKSYYDQRDIDNALLGFSQAEQHNSRFAEEGAETNNFHAAEAAYYTANIKRERFNAVKLMLPDAQLKRALKEKSDLLAEAAKSYQRVMQYQSEKMFEAAYRVGQLYEDLAKGWSDQERPKLDPIKAAVLEKDILLLSSSLLQKTFVPYKKALELAKGFDSLNTEQQIWLQKSKSSLLDNYLASGQRMYEAFEAMDKAPVPKEIKEKPLHYFQYLKQLLETLEPLKVQARDYFLAALQEIDSLALTGEIVDECRHEYAHINYYIGNGYDRLSQQILKGTQELTKTMPADEREELLFQLEDVVYELQDKAIFAYESAFDRVKDPKFRSSPWSVKILESLARLSPDKYGTSFYVTGVFESNESWLVREDSVADWNSAATPRSGWSPAKIIQELKSTGFSNGNPQFIRSKSKTGSYFVWKHVLLSGTPRDAAIYVASTGKYRLYINNALTLSDTVGSKGTAHVDSASGIASLIKGGDNVIAIEVSSSDTSEAALAILFNAMIDTTQKFVSTIQLPDGISASKAGQPRFIAANQLIENKPAPKAKSKKTNVDEYIQQFRNRGEMLKAVETYREKEQEISTDVKKERLEIQRLRIQHEDLDAKIKLVGEEIEMLKSDIESMNREQ